MTGFIIVEEGEYSTVEKLKVIFSYFKKYLDKTSVEI